jgi:hypothetical protein
MEKKSVGEKQVFLHETGNEKHHSADGSHVAEHGIVHPRANMITRGNHDATRKPVSTIERWHSARSSESTSQE